MHRLGQCKNHPYRIEAGIRALELIENELNPDVVSFFPPRLASLRCNALQIILDEE